MKVPPPPFVWILYGQDEFRRTQRRKALLEALVGDGPADFILTVWRGKAFTEATFPQLYELPFLAPHKVAVLLEAESLSKTLLKTLAQYLEKPAPHTYLILDFNQESAPSLPKLPHVQIESFSPPKPREAIDWVLQTAEAESLKLSPEAATLLVETLGPDLRLLYETLRTLKVYRLSAPDAPLTPTEVGEALGLHPQYSIYRLIDALAEKNTTSLLQIGAFFAEDMRNFPLLQILWHLRQFFQNLSILHLTGTPARADAIQKRLRLRFAFQAKPYEQALKQYSLSACGEALSLLRETEERLKGVVPSRQSEAQLLQGLLLRLIGARPAPLL